jgi:hypothetical protein
MCIQDEATRLLQTDQGQKQLSPEKGAVAITEDLLTLGRKAFYLETVGNEVFQTDVVGALDRPVNPVTMTKAIAVNRANPNRQRSNVDGSGHNYWVDAEAGLKKAEGRRRKAEGGSIRGMVSPSHSQPLNTFSRGL